jgi:hypothetical protein
VTWPEPNGLDDEFVPMSKRRTFRIVSVLVTVLVVLAMLALTLGPYLVDRRSRPARTTVTTGLSV